MPLGLTIHSRLITLTCYNNSNRPLECYIVCSLAVTISIERLSFRKMPDWQPCLCTRQYEPVRNKTCLLVNLRSGFKTTNFIKKSLLNYNCNNKYCNIAVCLNITYIKGIKGIKYMVFNRFARHSCSSSYLHNVKAQLLITNKLPSRVHSVKA
jgi:hypothetical protein